MSVYHKEQSNNLKESMNSIWNQTVKTDDFVLVCDGPLNYELNRTIREMELSHRELTVVRLKKNAGLGNALNEGIKYCKNELVARMDSDDISRNNRCELQLAVFNAFPETAICSGTVEEFYKSTDRVEAKRVLPEKHEDIIAFAKKRNPFNHPCVMYKKEAVESAGGYRDFYLLEDYYLWIRMLQDGAIGYNIQQPLLWMRAGSDLYKRRAGMKYAKSQHALFKYMKDSGFIGFSQYALNAITRSVSSIIPNFARKFLFISILRK